MLKNICVLKKSGLDRAEMRWSDKFLKQLRFYSLQQVAQYVWNLRFDADFAECGCWKGHSSYIISTLLSKHGFKNQFHIFYSFEGRLSAKTLEDKHESYEESTEEVHQGKVMFPSLEKNVQKVLNEFDFIKLYKGWISKRFISFILMWFLYGPTQDSLKNFRSWSIRKVLL